MRVSKASKTSFWVGFAGHLVLWLLVANFDSTPFDLMCGEISCWVLFVVELPVSLLYISGSAVQVTVGSLIIGSIWWGVVLLGVFWIGQALFGSCTKPNTKPDNPFEPTQETTHDFLMSRGGAAQRRR